MSNTELLTLIFALHLHHNLVATSFKLPEYFKDTKFQCTFTVQSSTIHLNHLIQQNPDFTLNKPLVLPPNFFPYPNKPPWLRLHWYGARLKFSAKCMLILILSTESIMSGKLPLISGFDPNSAIVIVVPHSDPDQAVIHYITWHVTRSIMVEKFVISVNFKTATIIKTWGVDVYPFSVYNIGSKRNYKDLGGSPVLIFYQWRTNRKPMSKQTAAKQVRMELRQLPNNFEPVNLILLNLETMLNYTSEIFDWKNQRPRFCPEIHTSEAPLHPNLREMEPMSIIIIQEDEVTLMYCTNKSAPLAFTEFVDIWLKSFDFYTWGGLLGVIIVSTVFFRNFYSAGYTDVVALFFKQPVSERKFHPLHVLLSLVFILILAIYETCMTSKVIAPERPVVLKNADELLNAGYLISEGNVRLARGGPAVLQFPLAIRKLNESENYVRKNTRARMVERAEAFAKATGSQVISSTGQIQYMVGQKIAWVALSARAKYYWRYWVKKWTNNVDCYSVSEPVITNNPVDYVFAKFLHEVLKRVMVLQFESGLTIIWDRLFGEEAYFKRKALRILESEVEEPVKVLAVEKLEFIFIVFGILIGICTSVFCVEDVYVRRRLIMYIMYAKWYKGLWIIRNVARRCRQVFCSEVI